MKSYIPTRPKEIQVLPFIIILFSFFVSPSIYAQDVYNFYFQKNTTPTGTAPTVTPQPASNAAPLSTPTPNSQPADPSSPPVEAKSPQDVKAGESKFAKWELGLYRSWISSAVTTTDSYYNSYYAYKPQVGGGATQNALGIQGAYRFNKFLSAEAGLYLPTSWQVNDHDSPRGVVRGSLGVGITPIHINLFGYELLEIAAITGVMNGEKYFFIEGDNKAKAKSIVGPYAGAKLSINLTPSLALAGDFKTFISKAERNQHAGVASVGLRYRF